MPVRIFGFSYQLEVNGQLPPVYAHLCSPHPWIYVLKKLISLESSVTQPFTMEEHHLK